MMKPDGSTNSSEEIPGRARLASEVAGSSRNGESALQGLIPRLHSMRSRELTDHFVGCVRTGLLPAFPGDRLCRALFNEAEETLLAEGQPPRTWA